MGKAHSPTSLLYLNITNVNYAKQSNRRVKSHYLFTFIILVYTDIDQKLVNSLHGVLHCEIGGLDRVD